MPRCFSRRTRWLDRPNLKAEEWRNLIIYYFPAIEQELFRDRLEHKALLYFVLLFRLIVLPEEEFVEVPDRCLLDAKKTFYLTYQRALGEDHCVFNLHLFAGHAEKFRCRGPATATSCFAHERLFERFRRLGKKGTSSIGKQILKGACKAAAQGDHVCKAAIKVLPKAKDTPQSCSSLFYTFQQPNGYEFYECDHIDDNGDYVSRRLQISDYPNPYGIDFKLVGVFKQAGTQSHTEIVPRTDVKGFGIMCETALITVPHNTVTEL